MIRQGTVEIIGNLEQASVTAQNAAWLGARKTGQSRNGCSRSGNDYLFTLSNPDEQPGKMGFRLVDVDGRQVLPPHGDRTCRD